MIPHTIPLLVRVVALFLVLAVPVQAEFNYEVEKRVLERINDFMNGPRIANGVTAKFRSNGGFPSDMVAKDRDAYLRFCYSLMQEFKFDMLYYGLEDGTFIGFGKGWGTYREPGGGYPANDPSMQHYYEACVDRATGADQNCTADVGSDYIQCIRNCGIMKCADEETQVCTDVLASGFDADMAGEFAHCAHPHSVKWCRQYSAEKVAEGEAIGFVPRTYYCHDSKGRFTERPGQAMKDGFLEDAASPNVKNGDCEYEDGTKVERWEVGPFVYCDGKVCQDAFDGGYRSRDYDPRYRGWYTQTKDMQMPNWSPPYPFFSNLDLGITYSHPIYTDDEEHGRHIFEGVLAVDYTFQDIGNFLVESYDDSRTVVVVYEKAEPNYLVAASTGRKSALKVLAEDTTKPCPENLSSTSGACDVARVTMEELEGFSMDPLLVRAYREQKSRDYPRELLTIKGLKSDGFGGDDVEEDQLYIVQSSNYGSPGGDLDWIILVISPAGEGAADAVLPNSPLFGLVCVVASLGFFLCLGMFTLFYRQRSERAVILADWRFTSAFLLGCAFLNLSSFTLLGENTNALCMLRMWSFHFLFALALSPLFVKIYRMWRMVGSQTRLPAIVDHATAALLSMPIVAIQTIFLIIFSFVDPPQQEEIIDIEEGIVTQRVICSQESLAFTIVMMIFEVGLVFIGCSLAYITRNMDDQFGEAKQLMFSMYNIFFIGLITSIIIMTMDIDATGEIVLRSIGIFWGTVFSSAAFVLPRLLRVKDEKRSNGIMKKSSFGPTATNNKDPKASKVRFSVDELQSSVHSDDRGKSGIDDRSQSTDKKSNLTKHSGEKSEESPRKEVDGGLRSSLNASEMRKSDKRSSNGDLSQDSFFINGTGWSVFETPSEEFSDEFRASGSPGNGAQENGGNKNMDTIQEGGSENDDPSSNHESAFSERGSGISGASDVEDKSGNEENC